MKPRTVIVIAALVGVFAAAGGGEQAASSAAARPHPSRTHASRPAVTAPKVAGTGEAAFLTAVLEDLGDPVSQADVTSLEAWVARETTWPPVAAYNPLNSERPAPGSRPYNAAGVQKYVTAAQGAAMTAGTLSNGDYPRILADLRSGAGLCTGDPATAAEFLRWSNQVYDSPACPGVS